MLLRISGVKIVLVVCLAAVLISSATVEARKHKYFNFGKIRRPTIRYNSASIINFYNAPYTMQLRNRTGSVVCDGTLIRPQYVLTAAHCFDNYEASEITVVGGATKKSDAGVERKIEEVLKHDTYNPTNWHNDAAILKLESPMEGNQIEANPELCEKPIVSNEFIQLTGWVRPTVTGRWQREELRSNRFPMLAQRDCIRDTPENEMEITSSMFCSNILSRDACMHNSGGPAVSYGQVCGIVLGGSGCADRRFPGAYTSVYAVLDFIKKVLENKSLMSEF